MRLNKNNLQPPLSPPKGEEIWEKKAEIMFFIFLSPAFELLLNFIGVALLYL